LGTGSVINDFIRFMKNIGIIIHDITHGAGTERAVVNLANMLVNSKKYCVYIISCHSSRKDNPKYALDKYVNIIHLDISLNSNKLITYYLIYKNIRKLIFENDINIVIGTGSIINCLITLVLENVKKIGCEHMNYTNISAIKRLIRTICYKGLDKIIVLTEEVRSYYKSLIKKVVVIPNSLSFVNTEISELKNRRIIAIGRLTYQKGFDMLIDAALIIKEKAPDWCIYIFGDGEDREMLMSKITLLGLTNYVIIKSFSVNIQQELLASSIYVMTSRYEGLPMVLIEAKSCGLPCISFSCHEGPGEIIQDGRDGFLVPYNNVEKLAERTLELIYNEEKRVNFGNIGFLDSKKYLPKNIFKLWDSVLKEI
jgi:glycosyltransferase involved in cell wall biosynthesis